MAAKKKYNQEWTIRSIDDYFKAHAEKPKWIRFHHNDITLRHFATDYREAYGVKRLGFTVEGIFTLATTQASTGVMRFEHFIETDHGLLGRDEALGTHWLPTPEEIRQSALEIRKQRSPFANSDVVYVGRDGPGIQELSTQFVVL